MSIRLDVLFQRAKYLSPLFRVTKVTAHGSLILVDKTRGRKRSTHDDRGIQSLHRIWNKFFFCKAYRLERFPLSVTEGESVWDLSFTSHRFPNRELVKIQKHGGGGGWVDVTPGGRKYEGRVNNSSSLPNTQWGVRIAGSVAGKRRENKERKRERKKKKSIKSFLSIS